MKRILLLCLAALWLGTVPAQATPTVYVPSYGETGWRSFSYTFNQEFEGSFSLMVSNAGDTAVESQLLVDNIKPSMFGGGSFEGTSAFKGYTVLGDITQASSAISEAGHSYAPTAGSAMASLLASGVSTAAWGGTNGAILSSFAAFEAGQALSFDWAFLARDYYPYRDFAKIVIADGSGNVLLNQTLAQITPVPGAVWLLGSGLLGLAGLRKRFA